MPFDVRCDHLLHFPAVARPGIWQRPAALTAGFRPSFQRSPAGTLFYDSLNKQDYPILMGVLMINAVLVILSNLLADIIYAALDPRIKYE